MVANSIALLVVDMDYLLSESYDIQMPESLRYLQHSVIKLSNVKINFLQHCERTSERIII